jgi:bacterial/archaeal transporter family-2 protein
MIGFLLLALLAGAMLSVQTGVNVQLRAALGEPAAAALASFLVGMLGLGVLVLLSRVPVPIATAWQRSEWWQWIGGLLGACYIVVAIVVAPRLGAATFIAVVVAGQMLGSLVLDHYGWVGFAEHPVSPLRLLGAALIVGGVVLVQR